MTNNENKRAVVAAIWANPERVFGCRFQQKGKYLENAEKTEEYDERGKIRLCEVGGGSNIMVFYNGGSRPEKSDVFSYLQDHVLKTSGFKETLIRTAELYGVNLELKEEEKQALSRSALAREIVGTFVEALRCNPEGITAQYLRKVRQIEPDAHLGELSAQSIKAAKEHLTNRGIKWSDDDFKALGLTEYNAEIGFTCVIPYYCNGFCRGIVLRNNDPHTDDRYRYSVGLGRQGYCDRLIPDKPAIFVEGQFDAIRLIQAGLTNVIAMGGATISEDIINLLYSRNIYEITYMPDIEYNKQGIQKTKIITDAIKAFQSAQMNGKPIVENLYIATLPTPQGVNLNGYKIDVHDYGKLYGNDKLTDAVADAVAWWDWELTNLIKSATGDVAVSWFQKQFDSIYKRCTNCYERERIKQHIKSSEYAKVFEAFGVTPQALEDKDQWTKGIEAHERIKDAADDLIKAIEAGQTVKVANAISRLTEAQTINSRTDWERQLTETFDDELKAIQEQPDALITKWELGNVIRKEKGKEKIFYKYSNIEFWPADISVICAVSSHGKTTFLVQSVLDMVAKYPDKTFLYVSCEENKRQLVERVLNTYLPIETAPEIDTNGVYVNKKGGYYFIPQTRKKTIKAVIRGSVRPKEYETKTGVSEHYNVLSEQIKNGLKSYAEQVRPRLKLIHTDASTESICGNIRHYIEKFNAEGVEIGGVFVDYMQLLTTDSKNYSRHDELKDICKALKSCAEKTEIPFVVAAQLNRTGITEGIDSITMANIGEGADIERIAHDIYFVWQVDKTKQDVYFKTKQDGKREWDFSKAGDRANRIFTYDELHPTERTLKDKYLYVEHIKARDGKTGGWGLLKWDGESGKIGETDIKAMIDQ